MATNAIIEGKIARGGFVTTEGFRDLLEIARQVRPSLYDTQFEKAKPLVPRDRAVTVAERLGPAGEVLRPLEDDSVRAAAAILRREEVESVAVCLLHAYVNPEHEQRVGAILAEELPGRPHLALGRGRARVPRVPARLDDRDQRRDPPGGRALPGADREPPRRRGRPGEAARDAVERRRLQLRGGRARGPCSWSSPGPAAGVIASAYLGETLGRSDILSFDMGGTTAKVGLIQDGQPSVTKDYNVGGHAGAGIGGMSLSGYPVRTPVVDLVEIGAGGGSIAWVDSGGLLRVGPQSAGADPGPVCYRRGGTEPTVTDANVVLGRLNPNYFLGGEIGLDVEGARRAIEERCAKPLGLDVTEAANGIVEIANAAMVNALHLISVQRGYDPRDFIALRLRRRRSRARERARPRRRDADAAHPPQPRDLLRHRPAHDRPEARRRGDGDATPRRPGRRARSRRPSPSSRKRVAPSWSRRASPDDAMSFVRKIDLRYVGQSFELTIPAGDDLLERFHAEHDRTYGFSAPEEPVEVVSLRLTSVGTIAKPPPRPLEAGGKVEPKEHRPVYFAESDGYVDCPIYDRYALPAAATLTGPAIVEEFDSTTVVHPGYVALVDETGNLLIERGAA